jgi:hypothetical protein
MAQRELDSKVAAVLDKAGQDSDEDEDALIAALEDDEDTALAALREQRLQQLHAEVSRAKTMRNSDFGTYVEVKDEKAVLDITTQAKLCVVHFFKPDFGRCGIMDGHLEVCHLATVPSNLLLTYLDSRTKAFRYSVLENQR